jgi:hypothetical protein
MIAEHEEIGFFDIDANYGLHKGIDYRVKVDGKVMRFIHYMRFYNFDQKRCKKLCRNKYLKYIRLMRF